MFTSGNAGPDPCAPCVVPGWAGETLSLELPSLGVFVFLEKDGVYSLFSGSTQGLLLGPSVGVLSRWRLMLS